jgi:hypothetical protein
MINMIVFFVILYGGGWLLQDRVVSMALPYVRKARSKGEFILILIAAGLFTAVLIVAWSRVWMNILID